MRQTYSVKEIYFTIQGEGMQTGRPAVFCRFSGCNLWSGQEEDRTSAICTFCDTDFVGTDGPGGGKYSAPELAKTIANLWPFGQAGAPYVVCTGGEPLLQLDTPLIEAIHDTGFEIAIETNGTIPVPVGVDWVCMSPKPATELKVTTGHELKLVYPQFGMNPEDFLHLDFNYFFLQPMDGLDLQTNTRSAIEYCLKHPAWRLSIQTHKFTGISR